MEYFSKLIAFSLFVYSHTYEQNFLVYDNKNFRFKVR